MKIRFCLFISAAVLCCSCVKHHGIDVTPDIRKTYCGNIVDGGFDHGGTVTVQAIKDGLGKDAAIDSLNFDEKLKYDVDFYHITYYTLYGLEHPELVQARALLLIPHAIAAENVRVAAYFHGTVLPVPEFTDILSMGTPSDFTGDNGSQDVRHCALPLASAGYCVICPDYTGYGPTANRDHPFVYYPELVQSAIDGVRAGMRAMGEAKFGLNLQPSNDIWIAGWSQGAGLALYAQKVLEDNGHIFNVKCTSTLSGPFNVKRFLVEMLNNQDHVYLLMALYGWAAYSINMFAPSLQRPMDQIFRPSIYDQTDAFIQFGNTPRDLFQQFFREHVLDGSDVAFLTVLDEDSTHEGWDPKAPVYLHHGIDDDVVPCFNSVDAYNGLKDRAANGVELHLYEGQKHNTCVPTYISKTIDEFNAVQ